MLAGSCIVPAHISSPYSISEIITPLFRFSGQDGVVFSLSFSLLNLFRPGARCATVPRVLCCQQQGLGSKRAVAVHGVPGSGG